MPTRLLQGLAKTGEATEAGVELAVRAVAMKILEHLVEAQFRVAGKCPGQRQTGRLEALGRNRKQKCGDRLSPSVKIGETFLNILAAGKSKER